ncbi:hypothetical protein K402DRAFT_422404 [Aulographum hederae CBS 113979]|uniref:Uncharacterized protein n=1 Tax=Aulographum hederae CBS 113979 TaxID=1176131 RepID=A0A6G1GWH6_9PEZI|nr:hypothetical protein K402DRAFT_422404 [Aulographum hederae CBS 113979]
MGQNRRRNSTLDRRRIFVPEPKLLPPAPRRASHPPICPLLAIASPVIEEVDEDIDALRPRIKEEEPVVIPVTNPVTKGQWDILQYYIDEARLDRRSEVRFLKSELALLVNKRKAVKDASVDATQGRRNLVPTAKGATEKDTQDLQRWRSFAEVAASPKMDEALDAPKPVSEKVLDEDDWLKVGLKEGDVVVEEKETGSMETLLKKAGTEDVGSSPLEEKSTESGLVAGLQQLKIQPTLCHSGN